MNALLLNVCFAFDFMILTFIFRSVFKLKCSKAWILKCNCVEYASHLIHKKFMISCFRSLVIASCILSFCVSTTYAWLYSKWLTKEPIQDITNFSSINILDVSKHLRYKYRMIFFTHCTAAILLCWHGWSKMKDA